MSEDRALQARKALAMLNDCGWVFDNFVNTEMRKVLLSASGERDAREEAYRRARVATELKAGLERTVEEWEADQKLEQKKELRNVRT